VVTRTANDAVTTSEAEKCLCNNLMGQKAAKEIISSCTEKDSLKSLPTDRKLKMIDLCGAVIKSLTQKVLKRALELGQGCGRVAKTRLKQSLEEIFDPISARRHLSYLISVYGAPLCDDELKEWASLSPSDLIRIVVYAETRITARHIVELKQNREKSKPFRSAMKHHSIVGNAQYNEENLKKGDSSNVRAVQFSNPVVKQNTRGLVNREQTPRKPGKKTMLIA